MLQWEWIAVGYASYLAIVAIARPQFARARRPVLTTAAIGWAWFAVSAVSVRGATHPGPALQVVLPALALLLGYRLSGLFFVAPDLALERALRVVDDRFLTQSGILDRFRSSPRIVQEYFEFSYLLVYLVVPAGAATLVVAGHVADVDRFWATVLLAEFTCYGMLPWIQTRSPRVFDVLARPQPSRLFLRRLNLSVLSRGSIGANTVPSGHAAGAVATALAVGSVMPAAGAVFLGLAASIVVATVLGRYHYLVDSVLGVLVALAAWSLV